MNMNHIPSALSADELAHVAGGWCGNEVRTFKFPIPEPEPDPWFRSALTSRLDMVALNPQPLPPQEIGALEAAMTLG